MTNDMNKWKKSVDQFNNDIKAQEQSLAQTKQDFEREKFSQGQSNWWKEYDQKQGQYNLAKKEYELAVKRFENDKTQATWSNVIKTADTAANILNTLTKARSVALSDLAKVAAKAAAK
jgi:molecular chaperone GrpE (heat shock protein)